MARVTRPLSVLASLMTLLGLVLVPPPGPAASVEAPVHAVDVTGTGTTTYPSFSSGTTRYGIRTTADTGGVVTVVASTSDPAGRVFVDGARALGPVEVEDLESGDEVSVIVRDASGTTAYSYVYLPARFPVLRGTAAAGMQPGHTLMTLNPFSGVPARFMTAVDGNGVPAYLAPYTGNRHDFRRHPDGTFSVSQDVALPAGNVILELDEELQEVARRTTVGLVNTDFHDYLRLPDGNRVMMAYEPRDDDSGLFDAVVQEIEPDGDVAFEWDSGDHIDIAAEGVGDVDQDYAHINSVQVMDDGDYLISMRHLSVVLKVARTAHDGFVQGDVVWRLGGRLSDFDLSSDPLMGPCAQHTASEVTPPGGPTTIMVFDNGSFDVNPLCVDPEDPAGPAVGRTQSRAVEFVLDEEAGTATVGRQYAPPGRFAHFAGSAERLPNGNTLVGWTSAADGIATELDPDFRPLWELDSDNGYGSYRVHRATVPDTSDPTASLASPRSGDVYDFGQAVVGDYGCTDRGGSGLQDCVGTVEEGSAVDTRTPGRHTFTVTATDGAGNRVTTSSSYTVRPDPTPAPTPPPAPTSSPTPTPTPTPDPDPGAARVDAILAVGTTVVGDDVHGAGQRGRLRLTERRDTRTVRVRLQNDGDVASRFTLTGPQSRRGLLVTTTMGGRDVTRALRRGPLRTRSVAPGRQVTLRVTVAWSQRRTPIPGRVLRFRGEAGDTSDVVRLRVTAR